MENKDFKQHTISELNNIYSEIMNRDNIIYCEFIHIAKYLLKYFLPINVYSNDFETIRDSFLEYMWVSQRSSNNELLNSLYESKNKDFEKVKDNEDKFYKYICKEYIGIDQLPKNLLLEYYIQGTQDLKEIDAMLEKIANKRHELTQENNAKKCQEQLPILYFYEERNNEIKKRILHFLKYEIKEFSIRKSYMNTTFNPTLLLSPPSYDSKRYAPQKPSIISNKFLDLPYNEHINLNKIIKSDKQSFVAYIKEYIQTNCIIDSLLNLTNTNHILNERKEYIEEALDCYREGNIALFVASTPSFIEGVLHELCLAFNEDENTLLKEGMQYKLDRLQKFLSWELFYEYYSFNFRLIRNKTAHGRLTNDDIIEYADILLLDMYHISTLTTSDTIPLNHKLFIINELLKNIAKPNYKYFMKYLLLQDIEIVYNN